MRFTDELQKLIDSMPQSFVEDGYVEQALRQAMENANKNYVPKVIPLLEKKLGKAYVEALKKRESYGKQEYRVFLCKSIDDLMTYEGREERTTFVGVVKGFLEAFATGLLMHYNYDITTIAKDLKSAKKTFIDDYYYNCGDGTALDGWYCDIWDENRYTIVQNIWVEKC